MVEAVGSVSRALCGLALRTPPAPWRPEEFPMDSVPMIWGGHSPGLAGTRVQDAAAED